MIAARLFVDLMTVIDPSRFFNPASMASQATNSRTRASNRPRVTTLTFSPRGSSNTPMTYSAAASERTTCLRAAAGVRLLAANAFDVDRLEPSCPDDLRDSARIVPIHLYRHGAKARPSSGAIPN